MPEIHPTAVVSDQAHLADDVSVGPFCLIQGEVTVGPGTRLLSHVCLQGPLTMGANNTVYPQACLGYAPQDLKFDPDAPGAGLVIGDGNVLREGVTISRATGEQPTRMGDGNYMMAFSHLGHDVAMGSRCMLANGVLVAGHVEIGDHVIAGGNCGIHQFCRIGRLAILSGGEGTTQDVPPFCEMYMHRGVRSLNLIGLRRSGYQDHIKALNRAFKLMYKSGLPNNVAAERIEQELGDDPLCREFAAFAKASKRGLQGRVNDFVKAQRSI